MLLVSSLHLCNIWYRVSCLGNVRLVIYINVLGSPILKKSLNLNDNEGFCGDRGSEESVIILMCLNSSDNVSTFL